MMLKSSLPNLKGFPLPQTVQKFQNNVRLNFIIGSNHNISINAIVQEDGETLYRPINELDLQNYPEYIGMSYNYNHNQQNTIALNLTLNFIQEEYLAGEEAVYQYTATYPFYNDILRLDYILFEIDSSSHIPQKSIGGFYASNISTYPTAAATAYFEIPESWWQELNTNGYIDCRMTVGIAEPTPFNYQAYYTSTDDGPVRIFTDIPFLNENQVIEFHVTGYHPSSTRYDVFVSMNWSDSYDESVNLLQKISGKQGTIYAYHNITINNTSGLFLNVSEYGGYSSSIPLASTNVNTYAFGVGGTMSFVDTGYGYPKLVIINGQILGYDQSGLSSVDAAILQRDAEINSIGGGLEMQIYYTASVAEYVYNTYQRCYSGWYS